MKSIPLPIFFLLLLCSCVSTGANDHAGAAKLQQSKVSNSVSGAQSVGSQYYFDSLKLIKKQNIDELNTIDFVKFRHSYILARDKNDISTVDELTKNIKQSLKDNDNKKILYLCDEILEKDYTDIYAHVMRNYLLSLDGKDVSFNQAYVGKIMNSIFESGDGRTQQTAFHVFQVKEEYETLKFLRLRPVGQSLLETNGNYFDLLTAEDEKGNKHEIYFNINEHMQSIKDMLSKKN